MKYRSLESVIRQIHELYGSGTAKMGKEGNSSDNRVAPKFSSLHSDSTSSDGVRIKMSQSETGNKNLKAESGGIKKTKVKEEIEQIDEIVPAIAAALPVVAPEVAAGGAALAAGAAYYGGKALKRIFGNKTSDYDPDAAAQNDSYTTAAQRMKTLKAEPQKMDAAPKQEIKSSSPQPIFTQKPSTAPEKLTASRPSWPGIIPQAKPAGAPPIQKTTTATPPAKPITLDKPVAAPAPPIAKPAVDTKAPAIPATKVAEPAIPVTKTSTPAIPATTTTAATGAKVNTKVDTKPNPMPKVEPSIPNAAPSSSSVGKPTEPGPDAPTTTSSARSTSAIKQTSQHSDAGLRNKPVMQGKVPQLKKPSLLRKEDTMITNKSFRDFYNFIGEAKKKKSGDIELNPTLDPVKSPDDVRENRFINDFLALQEKNHGNVFEAAKKMKKESGTAPLMSNPDPRGQMKTKEANEEVEEIDELSKGTLGSYVKKASVDLYGRGASRAFDVAKGKDPNTPQAKKAGKRISGIYKASDKLAKEEVEEIDEISKALASRYVKGAKADIADLHRATGSLDKFHATAKTAKRRKEIEDQFEKNMQKVDKRKSGIENAKSRLKEEQIDEKSLAALAPPYDKVTHKDVLVGRGVLKKHPQTGKHVVKKESGSGVGAIGGTRTAVRHIDTNGSKNEEVEHLDEKRGLWDNIHAKRERIKAGSGETMRKPGSKGAPTSAALKAAQNEATEYVEEAMKIVSGGHEKVHVVHKGKVLKTFKDPRDARMFVSQQAQKKVAKEEVEQIDEISNKVKQSYIDKAGAQASAASSKGFTKKFLEKKGPKAAAARDTFRKRSAGMSKAFMSMKEEDMFSDNELNHIQSIFELAKGKPKSNGNKPTSRSMGDTVSNADMTNEE